MAYFQSVIDANDIRCGAVVCKFMTTVRNRLQAHRSDDRPNSWSP